VGSRDERERKQFEVTEEMSGVWLPLRDILNNNRSLQRNFP
jgi:hypothetical protein